jgi:hypothetical protein
MDEKAAGLPHAPSHVSLRAIVAALGLMVGGVVVALAGAWIELGFAASPAGAPGNAEPPRIVGPVQYSAPALEQEALMRDKRARLHGRGTDPQTGEPFIPIGEAMRALADEARAAPSKAAR